jgi:hypothetical protein
VRSRAGYWIGGLLGLAAVIGAIVFGGTRLEKIDDTIDGYPKTNLSEGSVELEARDYNVYLDVPGGTGEFRWTLAVRDAERRDVPLRSTSTDFTYDLGGREGSLIGKLRAPAAGRYVVRGTGPPDSRVVFGEGGLLGSVATAVLGALAILGIGGAAALGLIVLTVVRRRPRPEAKRWP